MNCNSHSDYFKTAAAQENASSQFSSATFAVRVQKKVFSKVISRGVVRHFMSDAATRLFDNLYRILKFHYGRSAAEKVVKGIIKLVVKLGVIFRNEDVALEQQQQLSSFQRKMRQFCLTMVSFGTVAYSYDRNFLLHLLDETHKLLSPLVTKNLSEKSSRRVEMIFEHVCNEQVLDSLFRAEGEHAALLPQMTTDLEALIESSDL